MNRKWKTIVVSLLALALIVGVQGVVLAKATKVEVKGRSKLVWDFDPEKLWFDNGGNMHVKDMAANGFFRLESMDGDPILDGYHTVILSCMTRDYYGPCDGPIIITAEEGGEVLWEGHIHLMAVNRITSGQIVAQGRGDFEGTQLKLDIQEDDPYPGTPDPNTYDLVGRLLYRHDE
jgi:hypothetical protein